MTDSHLDSFFFFSADFNFTGNLILVSNPTLGSDFISVSKPTLGSDFILISNLLWKRDSQFNSTPGSEMKRSLAKP